MHSLSTIATSAASVGSPSDRRVAALVALTALLLAACGGDAPKPPNVVVFLADDLGYGDVGVYGSTEIATPNIDRLAAEGVRFTDFYANGPQCTPTRAAFLSGQYQQRLGGLESAIGAGNVGRYDEAVWLQEQGELGLPVEASTLTQSLGRAGYRTAKFGKWHLGYEPKFRPDRHGFDESFGPLGYGGDYFYHVEQVDHDQADFSGSHTLAENGKEVFADGQYFTALIAEKAVAWLDAQPADDPFFLYLPFTAPHSPFQGPDDDLGRPLEGEEWRVRSRDKYIEMTEAMDDAIGDVLAYLSDEQLDRDTVVVFFSDNGGVDVSDNGPFSGLKSEVYEGGIRVPLVIRWPGRIPAGQVSEQASISFDLTRSILELAGVPTDDLELDGYDIVEHVASGTDDFDRTLFWRFTRDPRVEKAVRDGSYKYFVRREEGAVLDEKLVDLSRDPAESTNLLDAEPAVAERLKALLARWEAGVSAKRLEGFSAE